MDNVPGASYSSSENNVGIEELRVDGPPNIAAGNNFYVPFIFTQLLLLSENYDLVFSHRMMITLRNLRTLNLKFFFGFSQESV